MGDDEGLEERQTRPEVGRGRERGNTEGMQLVTFTVAFAQSFSAIKT